MHWNPLLAKGVSFCNAKVLSLRTIKPFLLCSSFLVVISQLKEGKPTHEPSCWRWLQKAISSAPSPAAMVKTLTTIIHNLRSGPLALSTLSAADKNSRSSPVIKKP